MATAKMTVTEVTVLPPIISANKDGLRTSRTRTALITDGVTTTGRRSVQTDAIAMMLAETEVKVARHSQMSGKTSFAQPSTSQHALAKL